MVVFDFEEKEEFTYNTQIQNLGGLLSRAGKEAHEIVREFIAYAAAHANDVRDETAPPPASITTQNEFTHAFDLSEARTVLWERVRCLREVFLKCLVLLNMRPSLRLINDAIVIGAKLWEDRENVRRRAQDFYEIQWPPLGSFNPPVPKFEIGVSNEVLLTGKYCRFPKFTKLSVEQINTSLLDSVKHLKLPDKKRLKIERRLSTAILADYALALSRSQTVEKSLNFVKFRIVRGRIVLSAEDEFEVAFISDFRKFQFERCKIYIGEGIGYGANYQLELMGTNTLQSASNVVIDSLAALKRRALYEVNGWKALINASKETREKARALGALYRYLKNHGICSENQQLPVNSLKAILEQGSLFDRIQHAEKYKNEKLDAKVEAEQQKSEMPAEKTEMNGETSAETMDKREENVRLESLNFDDLVDELYAKLAALEKRCAFQLEKERERFRTLDDNFLSFEFYRYIIKIVSRMSRFIAWLLLRDQARQIKECQLPPAGLFNVTEWRRHRFVKQTGSTASIDLGTSTTAARTAGWRALFTDYFHDPAGDPSLDKSFHGTEDIPFSPLFGTGNFPLYADMLDIDLLPSLPLSLFQRLVSLTVKRSSRDSASSIGSGFEETTYSKVNPPVCRLTFIMNQHLAELSVELWPLRGVIKSWEEGRSRASRGDGAQEDINCEQVERVVRRLVAVPSLKAFYSYDESALDKSFFEHPQVFKRASTSEIPCFTPQSLNLTRWLSRCYRVMASLALHITMDYLNEARDSKLSSDWSFQVRESVSNLARIDFNEDNDISILEVNYERRLIFVVWVDFMTGELCINPSRFGDWLERLHINSEQAASYVTHLITHLQAGALAEFIDALSGITPFLQQTPQQIHDSTAQDVFDIVSDEEEPVQRMD
eukprot:Gregarina_sp_Poly_1__2954@NODE_1827_length_3262_cov_63_056025_g1186_i0_p1_GENE_NODE_1827_length_3262_cov_63_056025_g1186_i0NODE_1827_length_3262_cov_63_056025_g1186_i0_p1_ORF_typecomplete_len889_score131_07Med14/PF08638_11/1_1e11Med14/PF08638_11/7_6e03DUF4603/PF15376_6/1_3_NODE_1827_length_3262_cov_63_056025_g1186_i0352701